MPKKEIIIDCELSLLSNRFQYLSIFAIFAATHITRATSTNSILRKFYQEYRTKKTLSTNTLLCFLKENYAALYKWSMQKKEFESFASALKKLDPSNIIKFFIDCKDFDFLENIKKNYRNATNPIILVTTSPYTTLLTGCLTRILPNVPFEVLYAPLPRKKARNTISSSIISPSDKRLSLQSYAVRTNKKRPPPKGGLEYHLTILEQRLLNTDRFYGEEYVRLLQEKASTPEKMPEQKLQAAIATVEKEPKSKIIPVSIMSYSGTLFHPTPELAEQGQSLLGDSSSIKNVSQPKSSSSLQFLMTNMARNSQPPLRQFIATAIQGSPLRPAGKE